VPILAYAQHLIKDWRGILLVIDITSNDFISSAADCLIHRLALPVQVPESFLEFAVFCIYFM